jgi:hypothetical protein
MYASNAARIADSIVKSFPEIPVQVRGPLFMRIRNEILDLEPDRLESSPQDADGKVTVHMSAPNNPA